MTQPSIENLWETTAIQRGTYFGLSRLQVYHFFQDWIVTGNRLYSANSSSCTVPKTCTSINFWNPCTLWIDHYEMVPLHALKFQYAIPAILTISFLAHPSKAPKAIEVEPISHWKFLVTADDNRIIFTFFNRLYGHILSCAMKKSDETQETGLDILKNGRLSTSLRK